MAKTTKTMAPGTCSGCGNDIDDVGGCLTKTHSGWQCDECIKWVAECGALDLDEWEAKRRQRLAEQQEY